MDTVEKLHAADMQGLAKLHEIYSFPDGMELAEMGSSSIGHDYADCCGQILAHMIERHRVVQKKHHTQHCMAPIR